MLNTYLNQTATLESLKDDTDDRGQPLFEDPKTIKCRRTTKTRYAFGGAESRLISESVYFTDTPIIRGDRIDGLIVESVSELTGISGGVIGYKGVI